MRILHICTYYIGNKLYMNLIEKLSHHEISQDVFIPIRNSDHYGKNQLTSDYSTVKYHYNNMLHKYDRFFFYNKINKQKKEVEKEIISNVEIDCIHAHTIFSDGGTAYILNKEYRIPYIVNVRNTDINTFYKYGIHLRPLMYKILLNAKSIVFISQSYKQKMLLLLPSNVISKIESKCSVNPNGIDEFWHENTVKSREISQTNEIALLFIGEINKNKNLLNVIRSCSELNKKGIKVVLNVVGEGDFEDECKKEIEKLNLGNTVIFHGYLSEKQDIAAIMDKSDIFVMPSFRETFGLVYIEAMSRGLPVIYSKGQGIDGFFPEGEIGYSVDPYNIEMITDVIEKTIQSYNSMSVKCIENSKSFNWENNSKEYLQMYMTAKEGVC